MLSMRIDAYNQVAQLYGIQKNLKTQKAQNAAGPRAVGKSARRISFPSFATVTTHAKRSVLTNRFLFLTVTDSAVTSAVMFW